VVHVVELRCKPEACVSILGGIIRDFNWQAFRPHYGHGVDSSSNRNKYQEYILGVKAAGA
jgi:hypothetical protein